MRITTKQFLNEMAVRNQLKNGLQVGLTKFVGMDIHNGPVNYGEFELRFFARKVWIEQLKKNNRRNKKRRQRSGHK